MDLEKLLETGERCIHNEPPACMAGCPVHLDVIAFMTEIENGDFKKAYKLMENRIPFARIIGMICDHPCENLCVRGEIDSAVSISDLEKAAIRHGYTASKRLLALPKTKGKVAIVGGGIGGMTAAYELDKKGYQVTLYEKQERLGGRIWSYEGHELVKEVIEEELQIMMKLNIRVKLNTAINQQNLEDIIQDYDAVFLGTGSWEKKMQINPVTFQVENTSLFAGGELEDNRRSMIYAASSGKRAAISIDRYIRKVSLTASREREGAFVTPLKLKTEEVEVVNRVNKTMDVYTGIEAVDEAARCLKCQCIECIKPCSHMKRFNVSPDAYARQINHNERIILGTHYANKMINACTLCGLCKEQCFLDISMKDVIQETRESMVEKNKMPVSAHDFALKDMKFSNSHRFSMFRKQPSKEQSKDSFYYPLISYSKYVQGLYRGTGKTAYLFYPGCQLPASHPDKIGEIYKYLVAHMWEDVGIYLGCCGAPAAWAGRQELMDETIQYIKETWAEMDHPTFILACPSCCSIFKKHLPEINYISLWEVFDKHGLPNNDRITHEHTLNIHDACATRYDQRIHQSIRKIVTSLGYDIQELKYQQDKTKCCGYGGLVYYANREQAKDFIDDRIDESTNDLLVYCAMCKDLFVSSGKRTYHILDLIYGTDQEDAGMKKMPTLSQRHQNRANVKRWLLKEIWGEEEKMDHTKARNYELVISEEVIELMEDRYILFEDIEKVIDSARINKERFHNPADNSYLARLRLENVTYWVRYEESGGKIVVNRVYSHRMEVVEG
ncbi:pyridine nucleotide-disulfide oxidoreductase/dicluster-binding protein [Anoxynatronum buryatiense]|uniref:Cysteine-rich domain-containing protein n=1 Tax=Anoxynatronum buryatiense TaxID=489973 RepID=A0AA46AIM2_9CLOT|nr:pyridine nucleotide-disulfide oxidoreductase/dicluster-binding protein [Anoxynatronum buryatiense]SMP51873.1 Cysteine-rich domain-containing protein [Anoxynatronum buryatiense]